MIKIIMKDGSVQIIQIESYARQCRFLPIWRLESKSSKIKKIVYLGMK